MTQQNNWWIYLIRTPHHALYCGITTNVERRFAEHQSGRGAKALRGKSPLQLVWFQPAASRQEALRLEAKIKKLPKVKKEQIVSENLGIPQVFPLYT
ncbi:GIY-YIG nuclease superfamily protein [Vibrio aerogenes CECT 7868]|uniref:GIY-YIG nuclease superfamily protein n=1 Tax=Vibrio aerogenes CECT 7868 TaxID=1216006 RepID=A0A1M5ZUX3_9VIBR|nr:GIY-YIG nuclease family protein [Vibrio aerogenes]SHI28071.1 GIY-YIG nuclease superfamily protein [Vibrio aerogenes CECT 7868]